VFIVLETCCSESRTKFVFYANNFSPWKTQIKILEVLGKVIIFCFSGCINHAVQFGDDEPFSVMIIHLQWITC